MFQLLYLLLFVFLLTGVWSIVMGVRRKKRIMVLIGVVAIVSLVGFMSYFFILADAMHKH